jgi:hypothetical protein
MRVLVAGRNAKVLAKAAGTVVCDLEIHTAGTKAACFALLQRVEFDLIVACETLSDGSGLEVLSHVAVNAPNTLRIFAARPATLNLLTGELGLFGLFRTLPYPINFQKLWAAIDLARTTCVEPTSAAAAAPTPARAAPTPARAAPTPPRAAPTPARAAPTPARAAPAPVRAAPAPVRATPAPAWAAPAPARSAPAPAQAATPPPSRSQDAVLEETWDGSDVDVVAVARKQPAPAIDARTSQARQLQQASPQQAFTDIRVTATSARGRAQRAQPSPATVPTRATATSATRRSASAQQRAAVAATLATAGTASRRPTSAQQATTAIRVTSTTARGRTQHDQPSPTAMSARASPSPAPRRSASAQQIAPAAAAHMTASTAPRRPASGQQATAAAVSTSHPTAAATQRQGQPAPRRQEITSGMRAAARYAAAHAGRNAPAKPTRIPESDAFKRARARRDSGRIEPVVNGESLAQLAKATLTKRPPPQYWAAPAGKKRAAWYVGSGVFAATTAAVLTFFMVNANNSIKQPKLPTMASITQPVPNKVFPWQPETQQPTRQAAFMRSEAPASTVADIQAEAEAASESADGDPDHPGPPPPYAPPPPSEPPSLESPAQPVDE